MDITSERNVSIKNVTTHLDTKHLIISMFAPCGTCHRTLPISLYSNYFSYEVSEQVSSSIALVSQHFHHALGAPVCAVCGETAATDQLHLTPSVEVEDNTHAKYIAWYEAPAPYALVHPTCIGVMTAQ